MRNYRGLTLLLIVHFSFLLTHPISTAFAGEIDVARQALRDGLWEVARTHARRADGELAKLVVLESYAREGKWSDVLSTVGAYGDPVSPEFLYYKAAALYRTGDCDGARRVLESADYSRSAFAADASLLHAAVLRKEGYVDAALAKLADAGEKAESKLVAAAIRKSKGEDPEAVKLWREVVAMTNAPERAVAAAAANLSDVEALRKLLQTSANRDTVRFCALRLGMLLVRNRGTFDEGARLIRRLVGDSPDSRGVRSALLSVADAELAKGDYPAAAATYREALETWPETSKDASVRLGLGWALAESARIEEALVEYAAVLALPADGETLALALVKSGDALAASGRREEALERYREALKRFPETVAAKRVAETVAVRELEQRGRDAFLAYRFDEARSVFAEVAKRDPPSAPRMEYYDLICLYGLGRDVAAERVARRLSRKSADPAVRSDAALWLAKFLYNRGRYREAESNFTMCAEHSAKPSTVVESRLWATRSAFAAGDFQRTVQNAARFAEGDSVSRPAVEAMLLQSEALIELARFDEAALVAERASVAGSEDAALRIKAQLLRADAFFAMGADNPARYREALEAYTAIRSGEKLSPSVKIRLAYKLAKTLERLKRMDEAIDEYYTRVVLAYRDGRREGTRYDDESQAAFSRAAFRLSEECESRGQDAQAVSLLRLVVTARVPASAEAEKRIGRINRKGKIL